MERPTRRSATAANGLNHSASNGSTSSRRRRREVERESSGAASDGADTDSSSVAVETGAAARPSKAKKPSKARAAKADAAAEVDHASRSRADDDADADAESEDPAQEEEANGKEQAEEEPHEEEEAPTGYATRARRERSQSVVSTTSDTSSIASEAPEEPLRPELHGEKLAELEKKKKMVEDGTLAEYCRRVAEFKEERNRLLQSAEWHKNLQLKNTADLYGFEVQRAHNIWQDSKDKLKETMLQQADALLSKLKGELEALNKAEKLPLHVVSPKKPIVLPPRVVTVVRSSDPVAVESPPRHSEEQPEGQDEAAEEGDKKAAEKPVGKSQRLLKRRKVEVTSAPVPDNVVRLPFVDISSDLASIMQARETASAKIHAALPSAQIDLRVDRRRLLCGKYVFEEGDEVVVTAAVLKEDYIGVISSVSDEVLFIKLSTGQKVRVAVDHIAYRRCEIRPFLRGSAGIESLQSSGWVECEPF